MENEKRFGKFGKLEKIGNWGEKIRNLKILDKFGNLEENWKKKKLEFWKAFGNLKNIWKKV